MEWGCSKKNFDFLFWINSRFWKKHGIIHFWHNKNIVSIGELVQNMYLIRMILNYICNLLFINIVRKKFKKK